MGGYVTIARRCPDGLIQSYQGWTNPVPEWIRDPKMFTDSEAHLNEWFDHLASMAAPGDNCYYVNLGSVYPTEYGMVFIDQISNQILHCQWYSRLGTGLVNSIFHDGDGSFTANLMEFVRAKRFLGIDTRDTRDKASVLTCEQLFGTPHPTEDQVLKFFQDLAVGRDQEVSYGMLLYNYQPDWEIHRFRTCQEGSWERHPKGMNDLRAHLDQLGIEINSLKWDEYMCTYYPESES